MKFQLKSSYQPTGDQPQAIKKLTAGLQQNKKHQTLLGVTGSGKTFTVANIIQNVQKPTLVLAHNKTLAAQLYQEFRDFFPNNAVSYFVSYYDYYQPEAYIPSTDTYIEKDASINDEIDKLRLSSTTNLLTRPDAIVVASVSCIYNLGSPVEYGNYVFEIIEGEMVARKNLLLHLTELQYERSDSDLRRGTFRLRGDTIQVWPAYANIAIKIDTLENQITSIEEIDPISGTPLQYLQDDERQKESFLAKQRPNAPKRYVIFPAKHYMINPQAQEGALQKIEQDLQLRLQELKQANKIIEAYRLKQKINYDIEMIREFGFVNGIENYSRYFDGRQPGQPPYTLLDYFKENVNKFKQDYFLTVIDESHISIPQIKGMFKGDQARKETLIKYGFRLPSALDNRPLKLPEFVNKVDQTLYTSATPRDWETQRSSGEVVEQLIRPTGLLDPQISLRSSKNQIEDLIIEVIKRVKIRQRVLVTTLTKKMAEALTEYLNSPNKIKKLVKSYQARQKFQKTSTNKVVSLEQISQHSIEEINTSHLSTAQIDHQQLISKQLQLPKVAYLHSEVKTLERSDILADLRRGKYDVLVGINLLREGLDLPEVSLVAILDADKEGFLRSSTSLVQTMGRAARHEAGTVILYADQMTKSMKIAIEETQRRRQIQEKYNQKHSVTPTTINKPIRKRLLKKQVEAEKIGKQFKDSKNQPKKPLIIQLSKKDSVDLNNFDPESLTPDEKKKLKQQLTRSMRTASKDLDFELAAIIRDTIKKL